MHCIQDVLLMCDRLNSVHLQLLNHCEVWWLSKGCVLNLFDELRRQVYMFLQDQCSPLAEHYISNFFWANWPAFQMCLTS